MKAYISKQIFTGEDWLRNHAILVKDQKILDLMPADRLPENIDSVVIRCSFLAPAFIDIQVYGAHGKLFAVYPEPDALLKLVEYERAGGAAYCLPTVATNTYDVFHRCIDAVREYWSQGGEGILGLHIEGPWISKARRGAHIEELIHSPSIEQVQDLLEYGNGVIKMITLAPEACSAEVIELIRQHDILISAGHSDATYEQAVNAFDKGVKSVTHLFNAMSPLHHRQPGLVAAAMNHGSVMASIIPDGFHVDFTAISLAKKVMGQRLFVITDAVTETTEGHYQHYLSGDKYEAAGILSGSALNMCKAYFNLVDHCGIDRSEGLRMCSLYPAKAISMDHKLGMITKGYRFSIVAIHEDSRTAEVIG